MSSTSAGAGDNTVFIVIIVLILLVLRRVYRSYHGIRFSITSTMGVLVLYAGIGLLFSGESFFEGVSILLAAPYVLVIVVAALFSYRITDRRISFWKGGDGQVYFKGGMLVYLIYVAALIARLSIDIVVIGPSSLDFTPTTTILTGTALYATIATDLLLMFGLGLLIGRNARVLKRYRRIERGEEPLPDSPPPVQPLFGGKTEPSTPT